MIKFKKGQIWAGGVKQLRITAIEHNIHYYDWNEKTEDALKANNLNFSSFASAISIANWIKSSNAVLLNGPKPNRLWQRINEEL